MEKIMFSIRLARAEVWDIPHPAKHRRLKCRPAGRGAGLVCRPQARRAAASPRSPWLCFIQRSLQRLTGFKSSALSEKMAFLTIRSSWTYQRITRDCLPRLIALGIYQLTHAESREENDVHPFLFEVHSHFHLQWQLVSVNWIHFSPGCSFVEDCLACLS